MSDDREGQQEGLTTKLFWYRLPAAIQVRTCGM